MTKTLFRVICTDAVGARSNSQPQNGLQQGLLYDVVADVRAAVTARVPDGTASGYLVRDSDTGQVLPQLYRRDRFVKENEAGAQAATADNPGDKLGVGDVVVCTDAVGARSFSAPETMLEQDETYEITGDLTDAVTVRKPEGGASGFTVKRTDDDVHLAGVWNRRRFARA